ncbi:MAG: AAA family ATPase, partial [Planctomycetota bacterium]
DRFMFKIHVTYPAWDEEREVVKTTTSDRDIEITPVLGAEDMLACQRAVRRVPVADHVVEYAMRLVRQTRVGEPGIPDFIKENVSWGAGPRACQFLVLGAKARAALAGRNAANTDDIRAVAGPVLRHRILTNFAAESAGITPDKLIERILESTSAKDVGAAGGAEAASVLKQD